MSQAAPEPIPQNQKKPRSRVERVLVWGVIVGLIVVVGFELRAHLGFTQAYQSVTEKLRAAEAKGSSVSEADVRASVGGIEPAGRMPIYGLMRTADREDTYVWHGLLKSRRMYVYYGVGEDPDVLFVTTVQEPKPQPVDLRMFGLEPATPKAQPVSAGAAPGNGD